MFLVRLLLPASIVMTVCFATFASGALELPDDEVQALLDIFNTLEKKDWDFSNPCNRTVPPTDDIKEIAGVNCSNCAFVNGKESYRVVGIILKGQNLSGTLPPNLGKLPCLQVLDLSRNYLNGSIPSAWGSVKQLADISLLGNRLTGAIPSALANIKTLKNLTVEFNQLSGNLPPELGNMPSIKRLLLSSNNFTGELPPSFANLTSLQDFRISDNQFSGQIPNYIQNWRNLTKLFIQASGLRGPIPSLDLLGNLTDLRISDLNGSYVTFPLKNISVPQWKILILRNCNLTGTLPNQIFLPRGGRTEFQMLDLSFNSLSGEIPSSFESLSTVDNIYLTRNLLTGPIPAWILESRKKIDLSFNNFTIEKSNLSSSSCSQNEDRHINLFKSSSMGNETILSCSGTSLPRCSQNGSTRLHINCGGEQEIVDGTVYDADTDQRGPSNFVLEKDWSFSSTGKFMSRKSQDYISINSTELSTDTTDPILYTTARFSPLSLTYYAFCLVSGRYRVRLHFAEIVFTDDETYSSLGRRIFDVYIQGERVLKDFDIVKAAGGVRKQNIQRFNAVVTNGTLEIRFYWAGKGTTDIPSQGNYGPLISAISVETHPSGSISVGAVVGILVAGAFVIILFVVAILWWKGCLGQRSSATDHDLGDLELKTGTFSTLRQIKTATNNFDEENKIGEGGFGSVYKGLLSDGTVMAVK